MTKTQIFYCETIICRGGGASIRRRPPRNKTFIAKSIISLQISFSLNPPAYLISLSAPPSLPPTSFTKTRANFMHEKYHRSPLKIFLFKLSKFISCRCHEFPPHSCATRGNFFSEWHAEERRNPRSSRKFINLLYFLNLKGIRKVSVSGYPRKSNHG